MYEPTVQILSHYACGRSFYKIILSIPFGKTLDLFHIITVYTGEISYPPDVSICFSDLNDMFDKPYNNNI